MFIGSILTGICFIFIVVLCYRSGRMRSILAGIMARSVVVHAYEIKTDPGQNLCAQIYDTIITAAILSAVLICIHGFYKIFKGMYLDYTLYNKIKGLQTHSTFFKNMDIYIEITTARGQQNVYLALFNRVFCDLVVEYHRSFSSLSIIGGIFSGMLNLSELLFLK